MTAADAGNTQTRSMHETRNRLLIVPLAAIAYIIGQALSALVLQPTPFEPPQLSAPAIGWGLVSALIVALGMAPLAGRLQGALAVRWSVLAVFLYLLHTANTVIETTIFTRIGGQAFMAVMGLLPAMLCALPAAVVRPTAPLDPAPVRPAADWAWRLAVGWLAFPFAYFVFGLIIAPLVIGPYSAADSMLVLPPLSTVLATQSIRSILYLLPTLAVMERWTGSRLQLWLALGWAHWALVGLSGLVMPSEIIPPMLRLVHALEIGGDSFLYTGILTVVLAPACRRLPAMQHRHDALSGREIERPMGAG